MLCVATGALPALSLGFCLLSRPPYELGNQTLFVESELLAMLVYSVAPLVGIYGLVSSTTLREKQIKIGTKVVRHAEYVTFQMVEGAVPRELFAAVIDRVQRFGVPLPLVQCG